jgi:hypothetical protein
MSKKNQFSSQSWEQESLEGNLSDHHHNLHRSWHRIRP